MVETLNPTSAGTPQPPPRRGPAYALAAMALVMVVVGAVAIWANGRSDETAAPPSCPPGTAPDTAAPIGQTHPMIRPATNQAAAFDERTGTIVYVDGEGATWTFDVCTNTWSQALDETVGLGENGAGDLVYDVDSDRTVGVGTGPIVNVYDASAGTWSRDYRSTGMTPRGAVYDPVSGLVVVAYLDGRFTEGAPDEIDLRGFDVETGEWTNMGTVDNVWGDGWMFLIGYASETDELVFHGGYAPVPGNPLDTSYDASAPKTVVHGLRTGTTEVIPGGPNIFSPWGAFYPYATGVDGAALVTETADGQQLCQFDAEARSWDACTAGPDGLSFPDYPMVFDPINDRLVAIAASGHVWAVDLDTGDWTELATR